jgi:pyridoxal phosphate enzyme (YggS family)
MVNKGMTSFPTCGSVGDRIRHIQSTLPSHVRLIAVTKQKSVDAIRAAYAAGIRDFGENRVQEAEDKQAQLTDLEDVTWHLLGHLQSNKAARALELFDWIHSVDSLKIAKRLDRLAEERSLCPDVCLQVKLRSDPNKYGWSVDELRAALPELNQLKHLAIAGLMVIPPFGLPEPETLGIFTEARQLFESINAESYDHLRLQDLSLGMSEDYLLAVQAGSTMVRLGRILFGDRS